MLNKIQYLRKKSSIGMGAVPPIGGVGSLLINNIGTYTDDETFPGGSVWVDPNVDPDTQIILPDPDDYIPRPQPTPNPTPTYTGPNFSVEGKFDNIVNSFYEKFKTNGINTIECMPADATAAFAAIDKVANAFQTFIEKNLTFPPPASDGVKAKIQRLNDNKVIAYNQIISIQNDNKKIIDANKKEVADQLARDAETKRLEDLAKENKRLADIELARKNTIYNAVVAAGTLISNLDIQSQKTVGRYLVNGLDYISNKKDIHTRDEAGNIIITNK